MRGATRSSAWDLDIQAALKTLDRESVEKVAKMLGLHKKMTDVQVHDLVHGDEMGDRNLGGRYDCTRMEGR
jgi:hypothetical protein